MDEECRFMEGKCTNNAVYILRTLIEGMICNNRDIYLCFIYYTEEFAKVNHKEIIRKLKYLNINEKDL